MTVSSELNKQRTTGNNITVAFPATIKIFAETDIGVTIIDNTDDSLTNTLTLNDGGALGFTVVFDTDAETLTVTVNTAPTATEDIQILRALPVTQTTDFPVATKFPAVASENALDKNTMILQDQQEQLDRAFVLPEESSATNPSLPAPSSRRALLWDPAEDGTIINSVNDPDAAQADAAASATAAATSEGNAATSATAAATSATNAATSATSAADSANSQIRFAFATSIVMADPGAGNFRLNNATVSSVTAIAFDATMNQTGFPDISDYLATWDDSTNTVTGQLTLIKKGEPETFALFNVTAVTDNTGWLQITVAHVQSNGTFSASDNIDTFFARAGDVGSAFDASDITGQTPGTISATDNIVYENGAGGLETDDVQGILDLVPTVTAGLVLLSTATASASSSVDFTSSIDSTFDEYQIHIINLIPASISRLFMRTTTDGGSTFDNGASDYNWNLWSFSSNGADAAQSVDTADSEIEVTRNTISTVSGRSLSGIIHLYGPSNSSLETLVGMNTAYNSGGTIENTIGTAARSASEDVDGVRFLMSSGNITSGEFKLYGVQKS